MITDLRICAGWKKRFGTVLLFLFFIQLSYAQTIVSGMVSDASTKEPIPFASVYFKDGKGVTADSTGHFSISTESKTTQLVFSYIGYKQKTVTVLAGQEQTISVELTLDGKGLNAVVVKSRRKIKYHNRDNPAVELIRKVIANRDKNRPEHYDYTEYEQYEKIQLYLSQVPGNLIQSRLLRKYRFLFQNADTTKVPGKSLIPVYLEENLSDKYYRKNPEQTKTVELANKRVNYSDLIDSTGFSTYLKRLYEDVDIYDNNISLFTTQFLSPISDLAPSFYMFFIRDTVTDASGSKLIKMYFTPRNTNDFLFRGTMYITLDSNYAVQKLDMVTSPNINLNWIRSLHVGQAFEKNEADGKYHLIRSDVLAEAGITKGKKNGIFGERLVSYKNYKINLPHDEAFYNGPSTVIAHDAASGQESFWMEHRHDTLSTAEAKTYTNIDSLHQMRSFKRALNFVSFLLSGYKSFNTFEIGPAAAFYGWNPVEGFKLRIGGRTTPNLSKRIYFETYAAYGFKDEKWKGYLGVTYSLNNKSIYAFPLNYIRASAQRETQVPGQELQFVQEDNVLLSIKRGNNDKWLYNTIYRLDYVHELNNHFSYTLGFKNWRQEPAGMIQYIKQTDNLPVQIPQVTTSEASLTLRWAPHEQFYQGKVFRIPIINKYPIFTFRYIKGIKDLFHSEYDYHKLNLSIEKRAYLSQFGYTDLVLDGGYVAGKVPYPLLDIHWANQTYAYQLYSYNMMNFMEFVSDHYASINIDHHFNGFIFNRIPLIKKLNILEIVAAKVLYGGIRKENDPVYNKDLLQFPTYNGVPATYSLNNGPYIEGSVGIENLFKLIRLDLVKRFTYLDHPDVPEWGIRARLKFNF